MTLWANRMKAHEEHGTNQVVDQNQHDDEDNCEYLNSAGSSPAPYKQTSLVEDANKKEHSNSDFVMSTVIGEDDFDHLENLHGK